MTAIKAHQLTEDQTIVVRGKLEYSRLMSMIEGAELQRRIAQQRQMGAMYITEKPHTTITIREAQVQYTDPNNPTIEEQYVAQKCYNSKKHPDKGLMFNLDNKSPFLPPVWVPANPANLSEGYVQLTDPESELDNGLDVSVVLTTFKAGNYANFGLGLDSVIVHEAPRYYSNNRVDRDKLAALGIVFNSNPVNPSYNLAPQTDNTQDQDQSAPAYTDNQGLPTPGIGAAPQNQSAPQATQPQTPAQPQQNQAPQAPQTNQYAFPQQGQAQQNQAQQGQVQSQPAAQPQAPQAPAPQQNQYAFPQQNQAQQAPAQPQPQANPNSPFNGAPQAQPNTNIDPWTGEPTQGGITYN